MNTDLDRATNRAVVDNQQTATRQNFIGQTPEPLNRRGRRHLAAHFRRADRQAQRSLRQQDLNKR